MKNIFFVFSFAMSLISMASEVNQSKEAAEKRAREIERAVLFAQEMAKPEVQRQWKRNEQWKDD